MRRLALFAFSGLLYALAWPGLVSERGLGLLAFACLLPALLALRPGRPLASGLGGFVFTLIGYGFMNWWLYNYDPLAPVVVVLISAVFYGVLFAVIAIVVGAFPRGGWIMGIFVWVGAEYLKTLGFLGYPFGVIGYSQYRFLAFAQLASLFGVWACSLLLVALQFMAAMVIRSAIAPSRARSGFASLLRGSICPIGIPLVLILMALFWGAQRSTPSDLAKGGALLRVALVQPDILPHEEDAGAYAEELGTLVALSRRALLQSPDLIVWPETAFVPSISWHERYRTDEEIWPIVRSCLDFIHSAPCDFLIGNNEGELSTDSAGKPSRTDYNAVLAFRKGQDAYSVYRKVHLVPFSEYFPFMHAFPALYKLLLAREGSFWQPGTVLRSLPLTSVTAATPICFEDGFGGLTRSLAGGAADLIIPIVNDVWSSSPAAEYQHAACSVFRAIENGVAVARCTNSGITCIIAPTGKITSSLRPFSPGILVEDIPRGSRRETLYSHIGDTLGELCLLVAALVLGAALCKVIRARIFRDR
ncbi:MAG TPA: apolipoprotein N-acyltransferase [Rectinemataceae bacterium]|nr:apolipoprotein N-acyltransferase [Rectinemataceae bacterium]